LHTLQPGLLAGMKLREIFAINLKAARQAKGLTQEELADLAEIDRTYVSLLERSQYSASLDMVEKLATALQSDGARLLSSPSD
jgi:transcriptional regulator with XRE-family HTH domain